MLTVLHNLWEPSKELLDQYQQLVVLNYPHGCLGCNGSCCRDDGDCTHLTEDGLCRLEVEGGILAKPIGCQKAVVGSEDCKDYRVTFGIV